MRGLVLEGGGTKGSYQIGVWTALRELNIEINAVTGTSIGALNGVMIVRDKFDEIHDLWYNIKPDSIFESDDEFQEIITKDQLTKDDISVISKHLLKSVKEGGLDISPLKQLVSTYVNEEEIRKSPIRFGLVAISVTDKKPIESFVEDIPEGLLGDYVLGSAYLPFFKMDKLGGKFYLDGGFYDNVPVGLMLSDSRIDEVIIVASGGQDMAKKFERSDVNFITINPSDHIGQIMDFRVDRARENLKMGYYDCMRHYKVYKGVYYYLEPYNDSRLFDFLLNIEKDSIMKIGTLLGFEFDRDPRRFLFEDVIPKICDILKLPKELSYQEIIVRILELGAKEMGIDRYRPMTLTKLIEEIQDKLDDNIEPLSEENRFSLTSILRYGHIFVGNTKQEFLIELLKEFLLVKRGALNELQRKI